jgi:hypothetical protein
MSKSPLPIGLDADLVRRMVYGDTSASDDDAAGGVDLTRPAVGKATVHDEITSRRENLLEREADSYVWGREVYHDFIDRIQAIDAGLESPMAVDEMRAYVMRMTLAYSGHPDPKVAVKALDMLARMKPIGLYEEKRSKAVDDMDAAEIARELQRLLGK